MYRFVYCISKNILEGKEVEEYAYIRVSTKDQSIDRQLIALSPLA